jgi:hypothetical protein
MNGLVILKRHWLLPPKRQMMVLVSGTVGMLTVGEQKSRQLPLCGLADNNPGSCPQKNCPGTGTG